jgi:hypothetical protein
MAGSAGWHYAISYNETVRSKLPSSSAGPSEELSLLPLVFIHLIFSLPMIMGYITPPRVTSILLQRISEGNENR